MTPQSKSVSLVHKAISATLLTILTSEGIEETSGSSTPFSSSEVFVIFVTHHIEQDVEGRISTCC